MNDLKNNCCNMLGKVHNFLEHWQLVRAVELAVLVVLCFAAGRILSYFIGWGDSFFSGFWVILVALLVSKDSDIKILELQWRLVAVALGVGTGFVTISLFGVNYLSLFVAVTLVAWLCAYFSWNGYQQLAILSLVVLLVSNYLLVDMALWAGAIGRILEAAIGMLLAAGVHQLFDWIQGCCNTVSHDSSGPVNRY